MQEIFSAAFQNLSCSENYLSKPGTSKNAQKTRKITIDKQLLKYQFKLHCLPFRLSLVLH